MYQAIADRASDFFAVLQPDTARIFHGRGHMFPGLEHLSVDWFSPVVLISSWDDVSQTDELLKAVKDADQHGQIKCILLQFRKRQGTPSDALYGEPIHKVIVTERGLKYEVQPGVNQNSGLFLDMQPLRQWLQETSKGKNVLNLFAYTCSLSVAALAGNARQVTNVDMSKPSINWGARNHALNDQDPRSIRAVPHNLLRSWSKVKQFGRYDTIIIDPPTRQRGSFDAEKNYGAVLKKLKQLTNPGANIIATVNSPYLNDEFLPHQMMRNAPQCRLIEMMPRSPVFEDKFPERALKIYRFTTK